MANTIDTLSTANVNTINDSSATATASEIDAESFSAAMSDDYAADAMAILEEQLELSQKTGSQLYQQHSTRSFIETAMQSALQKLGSVVTDG